MDHSDVSNVYFDTAVRSWHVCVRCIPWLGGGQYRCGGKVGCCFPVLTEALLPFFKAWIASLDSGDDIQTMKCFRCFLTNSECFALPADYHEHLDTISANLATLDDATATADAKLAAMSSLQSICRPLAKQIAQEQKPFADNLVLHNGARAKARSAQSDVQAVGRKRDKATLQAKVESTKRKIEQQVTEELASTPKKAKKVVNGEKRDLENRAANLVVEIQALEESRTPADDRVAKGRITKAIRAKHKERQKLLADAAKL